MAPLPDLETLVRTVEVDAGSEDPLDQLAQAASSAVELEEITDALLGHFVEACRVSGRSWSEISSVLGVTRQAAHKRFAALTPTFERFTPRAYNVLEAAVDKARSHGQSWVGAEHLLLALFNPAEAVGAQILHEAGLRADAVEARVTEERTPAGDNEAIPKGAARRNIGYGPRARSALRAALDEALKFGHNYIGTEHLLLGLYDDANGIAVKILTASGLSYEAAQSRVREKLDKIVNPKGKSS